MSIEIFGPQGYEYQYLISLLALVENIDNEEMSFFIEKPNEEDAQLKVVENGEITIVDIQVKSEDISLERLSNWIFHFESQNYERCLFSKLYEEMNRYAIFVTKGRASDNVNFLVNEGFNPNSIQYRINTDFIRDFKQKSLECQNTNSDLSRNRSTRVDELINSTNNNEIKSVIRKIKLMDNMSEDFVVHKIRSIIQEKYNISPGQQINVIIELLDCIRKNIGSGKSIKNEVLQIIEKYAVSYVLIRDEHYCERELREACINELESKNILLLTGNPYCGKSYFAKDIAQHYQDSGYTISITNELFGDIGAFAFLRQNDIDDRVLILEDPLGQVIKSDNSIEIIKKMKELANIVTGNRKVIITSRADILLESFTSDSIDKCDLQGNKWHDLTLKNTAEIEMLWTSYFSDQPSSQEILSNYINWLTDNERDSSIQLGHITNIYNSVESINDLENINAGDIVKLARIDSEEIKEMILSRSALSKKVFFSLGMCCNTFRSISLQDFAFVMSDSEDQPSINKVDSGYRSTSFKKVEYPSFPTYSINNELSREIKAELKYFRKRGFIKLDSLNQLSFIHPIHHYASYLILKEDFADPFESDEIKECLNKALGVLSKEVNINVLCQLEQLCHEECNEDLKKMMLNSLKSLFPAVKDRVIKFFDTRLTILTQEEQSIFFDSVKQTIDTHSGDILWEDGIPWFNPSSERGFNFDSFLSDEIDLNKIEDDLKNKVRLKPQDVWNYIYHIDGSKLSIDVIDWILTYEESFIRECAIDKLFRYHAFVISDISKYLIEEEHPDVIYCLFRGAVESWGKYDVAKQKLISEYFKESMNRVSVILKSRKFLENFDGMDSYDSLCWSSYDELTKKSLWNVWHEVFIEYFLKFDAKFINMDEVHMVNVTTASLKYVTSNDKIVQLADTWLNWLIKYSENHIAHDYGMSVGDYLFDGTSNNSDSRLPVIEKMLDTKNTNLITYFLKSIIDHWVCLDSAEKELVYKLIRSTRADLKWIKAVCLTRHSVPDEIHTIILGSELNELDLSTKVEILKSHDLLEECINVFIGYPQPLWWNGYHHGNKAFWDLVLIKVLIGNEIDNCFMLALREFIDILYNHNTARIANVYEIYESLLCDSTKRKLVFDQLLKESATNVQTNKQAWDMLFDKVDEDEINDMYSKISNYIELIEDKQLRNNIFELFEEKTIFDGVIKYLDCESMILNFCEVINIQYRNIEGMIKRNEVASVESESERLKRVANSQLIENKRMLEQLRDQFNKVISGMYSNNIIRLTVISLIVKSIAELIGAESDHIQQLIDKNKEKVMDQRQIKRKDFDDQYQLLNWFGV